MDNFTVSLESTLKDKKITVYSLIPKLSEMVESEGKQSKRSGKNQSELIKFVTLYRLHVNMVNIYSLLTGCKGRTRKYKPKVFHTARACEGCLENQGLVFPGTARTPS